MKRLWLIIQAKLNRLLDRAEKPDELLDYSYEKQHGMLQEVRRGLTSVVASKKQLEMQADRLSKQEAKLDGQARQALELGREDLARAALERKAGVGVQLTDLQGADRRAPARSRRSSRRRRRSSPSGWRASAPRRRSRRRATARPRRW